MLRRLLTDRRAAAAIEFAYVMPVMLMLLLASIELSHLLTVQRKVTLTAQGIADLVGTYGVDRQTLQAENMTATDFNTVATAAGWLMEPFPTGGGRLRFGIAHVAFFDAPGDVLTPSLSSDKGGWIENRGLTGSPPIFFSTNPAQAGSALSLAMNRPGGGSLGAGPLGDDEEAIVIVRLEYDYQPIVGRFVLPIVGDSGLGSVMTLSEVAYVRPRLIDRICREDWPVGDPVPDHCPH